MFITFTDFYHPGRKLSIKADEIDVVEDYIWPGRIGSVIVLHNKTEYCVAETRGTVQLKLCATL